MSMGEPTRRLNLVEADDPPAPPTLGERWGRLPTPVQAAVIVVLLCGVVGLLTPVMSLLFHEKTAGDSVLDAVGSTMLLVIAWGVVWFVCAGIKGE